ncbi:MAG: type I polyketide synthase, partial [bacterium]|nr:type I polyketide synthase [bacterium]
AFAGGVNLLLSSSHYRYFSSIGALSPTGRCHTFDNAADGYVPGECVAGILLKPLKSALNDGDRIYAVIKGAAALHGGYTPSLTAPSVAGEENVIIKAWEDAGIDPETISYIEAHGTGTKLGDPIEIRSVTKAFKRYTQKEQFCAIGSVKANIGHAEGAAGIAGIIKVIQQMRHKKIPCLPGFKTLNAAIKLNKSPLYINQDIQDWKTPINIPMRAGINSFGFSGAYAHVVIEEFDDKQLPRYYHTDKIDKPAIFVLSAKNEKQLNIYVKRILDFLDTERKNKYLENIDIEQIAYTSQVGREVMEERLAVIIHSIDELEEKLSALVQGKKGIDHLYRGQVKRNKEALSVFSTDEDLQKIMAVWIAKGKYDKLLDLWVKGLEFDWNKLYGNIKPQLISLPSYPFARERYWVPETPVQSNSPKGTGGAAALHPLLHQNTSDFS